jgi:hypothetical protein
MNVTTAGTDARNLPAIGPVADRKKNRMKANVTLAPAVASPPTAAPQVRDLPQRARRSGSLRSAFMLTSALCCSTGCTAQIFGGDLSGGDVPGLPIGSGGSSATGIGGSVTSGGDLSADPNAAGPMPLRRLSRIEYNNTVADLLGDTSHPADDFPPDESSGTPFPVAGDADSLVVSRLAEAAESLAKAADLAKVVPCQASPDEAACAGRFIDEFGAKAFRRPVLAGEKARLLALYQNARSAESLDFDGGIRVLIEAVLQSAPFLYHWELGPQPVQLEDGWVRLGPYELASRLSYFLWSSMPDQDLLTAAATSKLSTEAELKDQARRMLESPRAKESIQSFFSLWLGLDEMRDRTKDAQTYPEFTDDLKTAMTSELEALTTAVMVDGDGRIETLLTSRQGELSAPLAEIYGLNMSGSASQVVTLDASQRGGLLTRAGFQALFGGPTGSNPVKRGVEIYRRVMCGTVPPPPGNVPTPKDASQGGTTRQRFDEHGQNACAKGCHELFDGIGFAFENYDGIGRYRTMDNGLPVDAASSTLIDGKQVSFKDGVELSELLAESTQVKQCLARQAASFGLRRPVSGADTRSVAGAVDAYLTGSDGVRDLLAALAASRTFRYRAPAEAEVLQ